MPTPLQGDAGNGFEDTSKAEDPLSSLSPVAKMPKHQARCTSPEHCMDEVDDSRNNGGKGTPVRGHSPPIRTLFSIWNSGLGTAASPPYCPSTSWPSVNNVDDTPPRAFWTSPTQSALDLAEAAYQSPDMWDEEDPLIMEKLQKQWWWPQYGDGEAPYLCEEHFRKGALYGLMLPGSRCAMTWFPLPLPVRLCKQLQNFPPVVSHSSCHGFYASELAGE
jgi:hypothetical protein